MRVLDTNYTSSKGILGMLGQLGETVSRLGDASITAEATPKL